MSLSLFAATAAPKYRPDWAAAAPRVDSAAWARLGSNDTTRAATIAAVPETESVRSRRPEGRVRGIMLVLHLWDGKTSVAVRLGSPARMAAARLSPPTRRDSCQASTPERVGPGHLTSRWRVAMSGPVARREVVGGVGFQGVDVVTW
ncbi:hypothetical protein GCM10011608_18390 [Micromonospora sonchi]|uniref:Uncharacterized protein n=1 Tax=Micromonospora sonchi TaxID=1763543 RepID=A0A917WVT5_9ACTN|nr:hypothetical protein GCM10011608_18390 [Micromonospora sonchi]